VFIQGGGYTSNSNANWNGAQVVERSGYNILVVNFNYRVGLWGFLAGEKVKADGDLNVGLLDQRQLLKWVRQHIDKFGGDPDHVVIHGASAGAGSVALHMTAYGGRDDKLFVGAAAESVFFPAQPRLSELEWQFERFASSVDCDPSSERAMSCLRGLSAVTLQRANVMTPFPGRSGNPLFYWTPCVDGDLIQDLPYKLYSSGQFLHLPVLYGTDTDEGSVFAPGGARSSADVASFFQDNYPGLSNEQANDVVARYPKLARLPGHEDWFPTASMAYGEATFTCPAVSVLAAMASHWPEGASKLFAYRYDVFDEGNAAAGIGVPHLFEAAAIFGPDNIGGAPGSYYTYNADMVPLVMDYWISFVRALDPNAHRNEGAPEWPGWGTERKRRLLFQTGNLSVEYTPADQVERCEYWKSMAAVTRQ
jgi:acetylcholinesterase